MFIYYSHELIANHKILPKGTRNGKRTENSHLPYPLYTPDTVESTLKKAKAIGRNTYVVITILYENAKVKNQAVIDAKAILDIASVFGGECLEVACKNALKDFHLITYGTLMTYVKELSKTKKYGTANVTKETSTKGIVRGADYYRRMINMNSELKKELITLELGDLAPIIEKQEHDISLTELTYAQRMEYLLSEVITLRRNNLIITGPTGAGKTYLASVLGIEACKQTLRTFYIRMPDMLAHIQTHRDNLKEQVRYRKKLGNYKLLIIDEWLNYKINDKESKFIYELIEHRCGNNPTIFVGQYHVSDWHERLGGGTHTDSIMDRIIHNSYEIPSSDNNLRKLYDSEKA